MLEATITRVTVRRVVMPLRQVFTTAAGAIAERDVVIVEVESSGVAGWGEAPVVPGYSGLDAATAFDTLAAAGEALLARPVGTGFPGTGAGEHPYVRFALEAALADLEARLAGVALWRALGGSRPQVSAGAVAGLHPDPASLLDTVAGLAAAGYRAVKMKIEPGRDRTHVAAVRAAFPGLTLGVDGNGVYTREDIGHLGFLDDNDVAYVEQPLSQGDLDGHALLAAATAVPVCLDEDVTGAGAVAAAARAGAAAAVSIKAARLGGLGAAQDTVAAARRHGLIVRAGGLMETGIGRGHMIALAAIEGFDLPADLSASDRYFERDLVEPPWALADGMLIAPESPGIGVAVDPEALRRHTVATTTVR